MTESNQDGSGAASRPVERERVIEALCDHYAQDHLEIAEFERRIDRVHQVHSRKELDAILDGLPPLAGSGTAVRRTGDSETPGGVDRTRSWVALPAGMSPPDRQTEVAIFSGRVRKGAWVPGRRILGLAMMGGIELDFREAQLPEGETRVMIMACMGGVDVVVPPGVRVETDGFAILGGFDEDVDSLEGVDPDAPVIRITGFAVLGGVDVTCRLPGESPRQAKRRRKEARRLKREEQGRLPRGDA